MWYNYRENAPTPPPYLMKAENQEQEIMVDRCSSKVWRDTAAKNTSWKTDSSHCNLPKSKGNCEINQVYSRQ